MLSFSKPVKLHADKRPNVVFIITDDQRWDSLPSTGNKFINVPNIERISKEGINLKNFFVTTPLCSPSRASFLTGMYASKHKIFNNDKLGLDVISHTLVTFPRQLREAGYETAFIGKWHMGLDDSRRPGFDSWISFKGQGIYVDGVLNNNGSRVQVDGNMTEILNHHALEFIKKEHKKPFCLYLSHKAVHYPYIPPQSFDSKYLDFKYELPETEESDIKGKPVFSRKRKKVNWAELNGAAPEPGEPRRDRGDSPEAVVRDQMRCIESIDQGIGRIFKELERTKQLENTIIIYTSDNGFLMGEHGRNNEKRWAYEESLRVPMFIRYPKLIKPGTSSNAIVLNIDIAPTILTLTGVKPITPMDGESIIPILEQPNSSIRDEFIAEYFYEKAVTKVPAWRCIRSKQWKLITYKNLPEMDELYDLQKDPEEKVNLIKNIEHSKIIHKLKKKLFSRIK